MKQNGKQIVILGAGNDSRGYRVDCVKRKEYGVKFFEVDILSTQIKKLEILEKNGVGKSNVAFVPVDFSVETFTECLLRNGWKQDEPTLFLWEGVTYYLPDEAVRDTLRAISKCAKGSYVFFDAMVSIFFFVLVLLV